MLFTLFAVSKAQVFLPCPITKIDSMGKMYLTAMPSSVLHKKKKELFYYKKYKCSQTYRQLKYQKNIMMFSLEIILNAD